MLKLFNNSEGCTPTKGTKFSACVDLYAREDVVIKAGETVLIPLGVMIDNEAIEKKVAEKYSFDLGEIKDSNEYDKYHPLFREVEDFYMKHQFNLQIRSSMSAKYGLIIANGTGIIDMDYNREIMICIHKPFRFSDMWKVPVDFILDVTFGKDRTNKSFSRFKLKKGEVDKKGKRIAVAQIGLIRNETYLLGIDSKDKRDGGFGSTNS